jgi:hypothetical protein
LKSSSRSTVASSSQIHGKALYLASLADLPKHCSAQVTDLYGFRVIEDSTAATPPCCISCSVSWAFQITSPFQNQWFFAQSHLHAVGPFGTNIEFQMRTDAMHVVASRLPRIAKATNPETTPLNVWAPNGFNRCWTSRNLRRQLSSGITSRLTFS